MQIPRHVLLSFNFMEIPLENKFLGSAIFRAFCRESCNETFSALNWTIMTPDGGEALA